MKLQKSLHLRVPIVVISDPHVTTAQVLTLAKERGASVGNQIAVNLFSECPEDARLYTPDSLESALRNSRINEAAKACVGQGVRVRVGPREVRLEFTGTFKSADRCYVAIQVATTKYYQNDLTYSHRKPFDLLIRRRKVASIAVV